MNRPTASHSYILFLLWVVGSMPLWASVPDLPPLDCALTISIDSQSTTHYKKENSSQLDHPTAFSTCGEITSFTVDEQAWDLGCSSGSFTGYFTPQNWLKIYGDGGVDVTGAPNDILVEGANSVLVEVTPGGTVAYRLTVPAEGSISFDWFKVGGSNFLFSVQVNDRESLTGTGREGFFFSNPLQPGDQFTLQVTNMTEAARLRLQDFQFYTNVANVTRRRWKAVDTAGNEAVADQFISLQKPTITQVLFPKNRDDQEGPLLRGDALPHPDETGFPVFDQDGDALTTKDQISVDRATYAYQISYRDAIEQNDRYHIIHRHWQVLDTCAGNIIEHTQVIKQLKETGGRLAIPAPTQPGKRVTSTYPARPEGVQAAPFRPKENVFMDESCGHAISVAFIVE